ncbi:MAG: diaminopimelate decarboxylase [Actinomycetota bacterium]|nr:MAG: diaminopimelate decarboxylase [Actinomycetota bacterium]
MRAHPAGPRHGDVVPAGHPLRPPHDLDRLDPLIWPLTAGRDAAGILTLGGVGVDELAAAYQTPLFVLDEADFRARAGRYRAAYDDPQLPADVYYAAKAFLAAGVARWVAAEGLRIDVCTLGELELALRSGVAAPQILFHGNNKSAVELDRALEVGVGRIVVDSFDEIELLDSLALARRTVAGVLVRVTVGVEAHTHEYIATAHEDQKFGFSLASGDALRAAHRVAAAEGLQLVGLHSHIGSQIFEPAGFEVSAHRVVGLAAALRDADVAVGELNLGGGMGIAYVDGDDPIDVAEMAAALRDIVRRECEAAQLPLPRLAVEPGRALIGPAGITVYEVGVVKPVDLGHGETRTYVSVDGGMSDNIRTALYDADYTVVLAGRVSTQPAMQCRVVGKHCESGDIVVRDAWLPADVRRGDLVAVAATGAYCRAMASSYNLTPRPAVVAVRDGQHTTVLRRETIDEVLGLDAGL